MSPALDTSPLYVQTWAPKLPFILNWRSSHFKLFWAVFCIASRNARKYSRLLPKVDPPSFTFNRGLSQAPPPPGVLWQFENKLTIWGWVLRQVPLVTNRPPHFWTQLLADLRW